MSTSKLVCESVKAQVQSDDGKTTVLIGIPKHLMRAYEDREAATLMYYKNRAARHEKEIADEIVPTLEKLLSEDDAVMLYTAQDVVNKFNTVKELLKDWIKEKKDRIVLETVLNKWIEEDQAQNTDDGGDSGDDAGNQNQDTGDDNGDTGGTSGNTGQDAGDGTGDDTSGSGDGGDDPGDTGNDTGDGDGDTSNTQGNGNTDDPNDIDHP